MNKLLLLMTILFSSMQVSAQSADITEHKYLKAFPVASDSTTRFVLNLPHKERGEEDAYKVELIVGKVIETDGANLVAMGTSLEAMPLKGWGFTYYEMRGSDMVRSTMMAPLPGTAPVTEFVGGTPITISYNSRIPVVVYVPKGFEVQYRIWETTENYAPLRSK